MEGGPYFRSLRSPIREVLAVHVCRPLVDGFPIRSPFGDYRGLFGELLRPIGRIGSVGVKGVSCMWGLLSSPSLSGVLDVEGLMFLWGLMLGVASSRVEHRVTFQGAYASFDV